jgi:3-(3-hydroxy-phenyl)propionate hydroxylase
VVGFAQDDTGVDVEISGDASLRAGYLVGCEGGRSLVRKAAGIDFAGLDPSISWLIAEVEMDEKSKIGMRREGGGIGPVNLVEGGALFRVVVTEKHLEHTSEPTMRELSEALIDAYGTDFGLRSANWISRFTDMTRQAASYRHGRVLLAGDAAHVHPPQGGQGLNTGVQDAVNLGWKLAQVINGSSPESLLDTYHTERHPVGARVLHNTMAQVALSSPDDRHQALRDTVTELLSMDGPRRRIARDALRSRHPLRPRRGTPAARTAHARSRLAHRQRSQAPCCTTRDPCSPTSVNPAVSTFLPGRIESGWSTPSMMASGSYRSLARSLLPRPW